MHRAVADFVGLFDERFGAGTRPKAAEDTDFLYRAYRLGFRIEYKADIVVYHHHGRRNIEETNKLLRGYCFANGALNLKHRTHLLCFTYYDARNMISALFDGRRNDALNVSYRIL
jgi:GT2 family glycosyltransferase